MHTSYDIREGDQQDWHLAREGKQYGPYTFAALVEAVRKGVLRKEDYLWRPGWDSWRSADAIHGLFAPPELTGVAHSQDAAPAIEIPTSPQETCALKDDQDAPGRPRANYFVRHWRGELSLPVSYWLNGILVVICAVIVGALLSYVVESKQLSAGAPIALALIAFVLVILALTAWQVVGIWRSASRCGLKGKRLWPAIAKLMVIVGVLRSLTELGTTSVPIIVEHIRIASGEQIFGSNRFRLLRDGTELEFSGGINDGTAREFDRMLEAASQVRVLHLNSSGGRVAEADLIAATVSKRGLITYVSERCESACTHIFLAGRERWLGKNGKLGFHQPSIPGLDAKSSSGLIDDERQFLRSRGLPPEFISKALQTPNDKMWNPTPNELIAGRIISGISDGAQFAASGGAGSLSTAQWEEALLTMPFYASLKRKEPAVFDRVIAQFTDGYSKGLPEEEIMSSARGIINEVLLQRLPYASEDKLLRWIDVLIGYMEGLVPIDAESCVAVEDGTKGARQRSDLGKMFPKISSEEFALKQSLIETDVYVRKALIPSDEQVKPYLEKLLAKLDTRTGLQLDLFDKERLLPSEFQKYCETLLAFYQELRRLPKQEAVALARKIYADATTK